MLQLLKKEGAIVKDSSGRLIITDSPENCRCCTPEHCPDYLDNRTAAYFNSFSTGLGSWDVSIGFAWASGRARLSGNFGGNLHNFHRLSSQHFKVDARAVFFPKDLASNMELVISRASGLSVGSSIVANVGSSNPDRYLFRTVDGFFYDTWAEDGIAPADNDLVEMKVRPTAVPLINDVDFLINSVVVASAIDRDLRIEEQGNQSAGFPCNVRIGLAVTNHSVAGASVGVEFDDFFGHLYE